MRSKERIEFASVEEARKYHVHHPGHVVGRVWYNPEHYGLVEAVHDGVKRQGVEAMRRVASKRKIRQS